MYLEPWMILVIAIAFGACAYLNYRSGKRAGLLLGIEGAFSYLERHKIIVLKEDGSIKGNNRTLKAVDISSQL